MGKRVSPRDVEKFVSMRDEGYQPKDIADETDWNVNTIRHWLKKHDDSQSEPAVEESQDTPDPGYSTDPADPVPAPAPRPAPAPSQDVFDDPDDIFSGTGPGPADVHDLLDKVLERMGVKEDKRSNLVDMVRTTPQYSDSRGMFSFLIDMGMNGHKARLCIEQVFGMQAANENVPQQFGGPQNFNMPNQSPNLPGPMAQPNFNFPQPQQTQWAQDQHGRWIQVHVHNPAPPPTQQQQQITPADVQKAVAEAVAETEAKRTMEDNFGAMQSQINQLAKMIQSNQGGGDDTIVEVVAERNPDGTVMKDPDTGEIIRKQISSPASARNPQSDLTNQLLGHVMEMSTSRPDSVMDEQKLENVKLQAQLAAEKARGEQAAENAALRAQIAAQQQATTEALKGVADAVQMGDGVGDEVRMGLAKIDSQTKVVEQTGKHVHQTVDKLLDIGKELIKTPPPKGRGEVDQWDEDDLAYIG